MEYAPTAYNKRYLDRIVVRGGFMTIYLTDRPQGRGDIPQGANYYASPFLLQDLDHPQRSLNGIRYDYDREVSGGLLFTFEGVTGKRFSLTYTGINPQVVFDEIIIGEPDS